MKFYNIEKRVRLSRLIERINRQEEYSRKLGITNESQFRGKRIYKKEN